LCGNVYSTFVTFIVTFRAESEKCAKDSESQSKWTPFDIIEVRENSAAVSNDKTPDNEPSNYSEKEDSGYIPEKNT